MEASFPWYRVYANGVILKRFRDRVAVVQSDAGGYDLVISNVSVSDVGRYVCIEDKGIGDKHITELNVTGKIYIIVVIVSIYYILHLAEPSEMCSEMCTRLSVCLCVLVCRSVPRCIPVLLHVYGCNFGEQ